MNIRKKISIVTALIIIQTILMIPKCLGVDNYNSETENNDIKLTSHINSEIGVEFYYPEEWEGLDNNHGSGAVGVWLKKDSNKQHIPNVYFWITKISDDKNMSAQEYTESNEDITNCIEQGSKKVDGNEGYYIKKKENKNAENDVEFEKMTIKIYVKTNYAMYEISYSGDKALYDENYTIFENMLDTVKFSEPTYDGKKTDVEKDNNKKKDDEDPINKTVEDNSTAKKKLPNTGIAKGMSVIVLIVISTFSYVYYKKYKNV